METRQKVLLGVLGVLVVVLIFYYGGDVFSSSRNESGPTPTELAELDENLRILRDLPAIPTGGPQSPESYEVQRNLFEFGEDPELQKAKERDLARIRKQQAEIEQRREEAARRRQQAAAQRAAEPAKPREPPPPRFDYAYEAFIKRQAEVQSFLAVLGRKDGGDKKLDIVEVGDTLDEKFVIKAIDEDAITVGYVNPRFEGKTTSVKIVAAAESGSGSRSRGRRR